MILNKECRYVIFLRNYDYFVQEGFIYFVVNSRVWLNKDEMYLVTKFNTKLIEFLTGFLLSLLSLLS